MLNRMILLVVLVAASTVAFGQLPPPPESDDDTSARPKLFVPQRMIEIGEVIEGDKALVTWTLENRGTADLVIEKVRAGCGCTVVKLADDQKTIPPGQTLILKAEFNSTGRHGTQRKGVVVLSNDPAEPKLDLTFKAEVQWLYRISPSTSVIHLRSLQRGEVSPKTLDITAVKGRPPVEIVSVEVLEDAPIICRIEPLTDKRTGLPGHRIFFSVAQDVPLGMLTAHLNLKLEVGEIERDRTITLRAKIVGDLVFRPVVVDATRRPSRRGQRLAPVTVRSPHHIPFEIFGAEAGLHFDVVVEPASGRKAGTEYSILLTIREDAPFGPFGAMLKIYTSSLDQPLVRIPVFATVNRLIEVEPPLIMLRLDGTPAGARRLVKLQASVQEQLEILDVSCDNPKVVATIVTQSGGLRHHLRYLEVTVQESVPEGRHQATLTVNTTLKGAQKIEIPVTIVVPGK